jgi:ADP-ribose pyrophosphatase
MVRQGSARRPEIRTAHSGRWLHFRVAEYVDASGRHHAWEYVDREGLRPAALMAARLVPSGDLILVRQQRAAIGGPTIEFPAGLVDEGEEIEAAAVRELREETGYQGRVLRVSPILATSPGLTSERAYLVELEIPEGEAGNAAPQAKPEPGEQIEVLRVPMAGAMERLAALARDGAVIDSRVWAWVATRHPAGTGRQGGWA